MAIPRTLPKANSDIVVAIPIKLVWKVQIAPRQKIGLGIFLCLNISMVIIACVRGFGVQADPVWDIPWTIFWLQMEACVAVSMASLTAFRSIFLAGTSRSEPRRARHWYLPTYEKIISRKNKSKEGRILVENPLPEIPSATLSGIRTYIRKGHASTMPELEAGDGLNSLETKDRDYEEQIIILPEVSTGSPEVCSSIFFKAIRSTNANFLRHNSIRNPP